MRSRPKGSPHYLTPVVEDKAANPDDVGVGARERDAGYADPAGATTGLFRRALELGGEHRLERGVTALEPEDAGGATVVTADGERTRCARVLVAAGPGPGPSSGRWGRTSPSRWSGTVVGQPPRQLQIGGGVDVQQRLRRRHGGPTLLQARQRFGSQGNDELRRGLFQLGS